MKFRDFTKVYLAEIGPSLKESTFITKKNLIETKILPYFGEMSLDEIGRADVLRWQNAMKIEAGRLGRGYAPGYLRVMHNQLSAILNYAVRVYGLRSNEARNTGCMGSGKSREMLFWTPEELGMFMETVEDEAKRHAFEMLYWTGCRIGELLALTPEDFDFQRGTVRINKSLYSRGGKAVATSPKTDKSNRNIIMPEFLAKEMKGYLRNLGKGKNERIFGFSANCLRREVAKGAAAAGIKRIRIHDFRHSHVSLLISLGFSALEIGERVGHEAVDITYRYAHLFPNVQQDMAARLNGVREDMSDRRGYGENRSKVTIK